jgi:hypothetical protein
MAQFVIGSAEALEDDDISERTLKWVPETGNSWNRWNVQRQADAYLRRLGNSAPDVVGRALRATNPSAVPSDLAWLHPAARPPGRLPMTNGYDEEPSEAGRLLTEQTST